MYYCYANWLHWMVSVNKPERKYFSCKWNFTVFTFNTVDYYRSEISVFHCRSSINKVTRSLLYNSYTILNTNGDVTMVILLSITFCTGQVLNCLDTRFIPSSTPTKYTPQLVACCEVHLYYVKQYEFQLLHTTMFSKSHMILNPCCMLNIKY